MRGGAVNSSSKVKAPARTPRSTKTRRSTKADGHDVDYQALARFRYELRKFLAFSEAAAHRQKLTPQQHQALLTIKGFSQDKPVSVGDLARLLLIRHHTAVELIDRMTRLNLIARVTDPADGRRILIRLTAEGERRLSKLSKIHFDELSAVSGVLTKMLKRFRQPTRR
jgi:DNA-binding MarR family transcriptional regulator